MNQLHSGDASLNQLQVPAAPVHAGARDVRNTEGWILSADINIAAIPSELKEKNRWVCWRLSDGTQDRPKKPPFNPTTGAVASVTDPDSWASFAQAKQAVGNYDGIGYVLDDEIMVDLDNCRDPVKGEIDEWAAEIIRQLDSYTEVSPSGTGVKILLRATAFTGERHRAVPTGTPARSKAHIELYWKSHYTTLTGHVVGNRSTVGTRDTELASFYAKWFEGPKGTEADPKRVSNELEDAEIRRRASTNLKFKHLLAGDYAAYTSQSEADLALCSILAQFTYDPDQIDRIFRGSGLYRSKWDEIHSHGSTYSKVTISKALGSREATSARALRQREVWPPSKPADNSRIFVEERFTSNGSPTLVYFRGNFYRWTGSHYEVLEVEELKHDILEFFSNAFYRTTGTGGMAAFDPNPRKLTEIVEMLKAYLPVDAKQQVPFWLESEQTIPENSAILAFANGLLLLDRDGNRLKFTDPTPNLFNTWSIPCKHQPLDSPVAPKLWLKFLNELWTEDQESIDTLQEIFGYLLTSDTSQQKIFLIIGPPRSGKGTIARILKALVGPSNYAGPTAQSLTEHFGLEPLIDKPLAVINDARIGSHSDTAQLLERFLSISGEDAITIDRKYKSAWTGQLNTRLVIMSNQAPDFSDTSGAYASRLIALRLRDTFLGREDRRLFEKLVQERDQIVHWALAGLIRLRKRGYFVQPASAKELIYDIEDIGSPMKTFIRECCELGDDYSITKSVLYAAWSIYCQETGQDGCPLWMFGKRLKIAAPKVSDYRPRVEGMGRPTSYSGIRLKPDKAGIVVPLPRPDDSEMAA
jgi:putative DNA primase/helicase